MKHLSMPFQVGWDITHLCNFRCKHCLFDESQLGDTTALDRESALRFVDHLVETKVFHLSIAGGEPLLYPHIVEVVNAATKGGMLVALSTNASVLTDHLATALFRAGLRSIQISLDGSRAEINDSIRGQGRFTKTVAGIEVAIRNGFSVYLAIVILKNNIDDLEDYLRFAASIGVRGVKVQTLINSGLAHKHYDAIAVSEDSLLLALKTLWKLKKEYRGQLELMLPLIPETLEKAVDEPEYYNKSSSCLGCQPGLSTVRVNSHGDVRACGGMVNAPSVGNVNVIPLKEIWSQSGELVRWRNAAEVVTGQSATSCGSICGKGCRSASAPKFAKTHD
jgi:MoaA/NifB/PqqE/SkfB family radical SAM enzyme